MLRRTLVVDLYLQQPDLILLLLLFLVVVLFFKVAWETFSSHCKGGLWSGKPSSKEWC